MIFLNKPIKPAGPSLDEKTEFKISPDKEIKFGKKSNIAIRVALIAIITAMGIGCSYAISFIPNVEILTVTIFTTSFLFGIPIGCCIAAVSSLIYHSFNPWGVAPLPTLIVLTVLYVIIAALGGLMGMLYKKYSKMDFQYSPWTIYKFAIIGASLTLLFDIISALTIIFYVPDQAFNLAFLLTTYIMQIPFTLIHVVSNLILFGFVVPPVVKRINKFMAEGGAK